MLCVPSLWLLLCCVRMVLIRILSFSVSIYYRDERGIYHYLLQLTKCKRLALCNSLEVHEH